MEQDTKKYMTYGILFVAAAAGAFLLTRSGQDEQVQDTVPVVAEPQVVEEAPQWPLQEVIGTSVEGRAIEAYTYGAGRQHLLFIGGIHGGYEYNSVLLAYELLDYLDEEKNSLPENVAITVVPSANPDGVFRVIGKEGRFSPDDVPDEEQIAGTGRFNANDVDLNRNFDCKWQPSSTWRGNEVSAGGAAFSEPEAQALRALVESIDPVVAVFFHSQSDAVYASECEEGILPETMTVMNLYSEASGYKAVDSFDAYAITGDAEGWLASIGIPAITVELSNHTDTEWERNKAGVKSLINHYAR